MGKRMGEKLGTKSKGPELCRRRNPPEREADRSRWREGRELPLCLRSSSLALYTVHPYPRGAGRKGRHQAERAPTNGTGDGWTQNTLRMQGDKASNNTKQNKKKTKKEKKSGLVIVLTPGLRHTLEGGRKGGRQEDRGVQDLGSSEGQVALPSNPSRESHPMPSKSPLSSQDHPPLLNPGQPTNLVPKVTPLVSLSPLYLVHTSLVVCPQPC